MKFFIKQQDSEILLSNLSYDDRSHRTRIRDVLRQEQSGFCAYSEKVLMPTDEAHIDHYDPRLKGSDGDGYENWYLVTAWINEHKPKKLDKRFLPIILKPHEANLNSRIRFSDGLFEPADPTDVEACNFLRFI